MIPKPLRSSLGLKELNLGKSVYFLMWLNYPAMESHEVVCKVIQCDYRGNCWLGGCDAIGCRLGVQAVHGSASSLLHQFCQHLGRCQWLGSWAKRDHFLCGRLSSVLCCSSFSSRQLDYWLGGAYILHVCVLYET